MQDDQYNQINNRRIIMNYYKNDYSKQRAALTPGCGDICEAICESTVETAEKGSETGKEASSGKDT